MISTEDLKTMKPILDKTVEADVVIVGGGSSGAIAAIAAARNGARTILVEELPYLGGSGGPPGLVLGMIGFQHPYGPHHMYSVDDELNIRGIPLELYNRLVEGKAAHGEIDRPANAVFQDPERTGSVTETMVRESGAFIWFHTQFVEVVGDKEGDTNKVKGVIVSRSGGLIHIVAKVVIDASGNGEAAFRAGSSFQFGRKKDGVPMPHGMYFHLGGVDFPELIAHLKKQPEELRLGRIFSAQAHNDPKRRVKEHEALDLMETSLESGGPPFSFCVTTGYDEAVAAGDLPELPRMGRPDAKHGLWGHIRPIWLGGKLVSSITAHNADILFRLDPTDRDRFDDGLIEARSYIMKIADFYQKYIPGYKDSYLLRLAPTVGVREGRRIEGDYIITQEDAASSTDFQDGIARAGAHWDYHREEIDIDWDIDTGAAGFGEVGGDRGWYHIPYRALLPRGVDGMLLAGRCISADHMANTTIRVQVICMATGHAAGTAAALAANDSKAPRELNVDLLQEQLLKEGAVI